MYFRTVQGYSHGQNQSNLFFAERDTVELEGTHIPHGEFFPLEINLRGWSMGKRIRSEKHETSLLLSSKSARFVIEMINWTGPVHEPRMVLYKQSEVVALFLDDLELGRVSLSCRMPMDLLCQDLRDVCWVNSESLGSPCSLCSQCQRSSLAEPPQQSLSLTVDGL